MFEKNERDFNEESYKSKKGKGSLITKIVISILVIFAALNSFTIIPTGYSGVKITFGQVSDTVVHQGINFKIPFVQRVAKVNNKQQDIEITSSVVESTITGKIPITVGNIGVTYQISADKASYIYKTVSDPDNLLSTDLVTSAIKSATTTFDADNVVVRTTIEPAVKEQLQKKIDEKYGEGLLSIVQVTLGDIQFTDEYNTAINNKNIAKQEAEQQAIVNEKNIEQANAEAEAMLIAAQAEKEANEIKEKSITDKILIQQYLEKWNGELPKVSGSDGGYMIDISSVMDETQ